MLPEGSPALTRLARDAELRRRSALVGWSVSATAHGLALALVYVNLAPPDPGFEFTVPSVIELGLTDEVEVEVPPPPVAPEPAPEPPGAASASQGSGMDAGVPYDASIAEAGIPHDAPRRRRRDAAIDPDAGPLIASGEGDAERPPVAFLPAGGQIALRIDLDRVRSSPVRTDVEGLLASIPDWQAILGDSGVEPIRDLSRVLVATPDLQRSSLVIAGRLAAEADTPTAIVERMIVAGGGTPSWEEQDGVRSADWPNPDATPRRVAIVGERHFVIARGTDMPRVLAIAAARAEERRAPDEAPREHPADALVALPDGAAITIEVEGVRGYVRRSPCPVPTRLRARADEREDVVDVSVHALYTSDEESLEAQRCFETLRDRYAGNPLVAFTGMAAALGALEIGADGSALDARTHLTYSQVRRILDYVRGMLRRPPPVAPVPPPPVTPADGAQAPVPPPIVPVPPPAITPVPPPAITPVPPPPIRPVPPPPMP